MSKHTTVRVKDDVYKKLVQMSDLSGMSVSGVIRWMIYRCVDKGLRHFKKLDFDI